MPDRGLSSWTGRWGINPKPPPAALSPDPCPFCGDPGKAALSVTKDGRPKRGCCTGCYRHWLDLSEPWRPREVIRA